MSGSWPNLYESVENLKDTYIQSNQCKDILLKPKSSVGISSVPFLLLKDVPTHEKTFYGCSNSSSHSTVSDDLINSLHQAVNGALELLKASLESKAVLTSVFMKRITAEK
ncbi:hypothetical protein HAX54_036956 [Datura stramonium]|uniref:Uncharacterized protein n=1 Tax=Datura stramonium TaxID=4076 RepID=A0ABS8SGV9_DATST|nr:hypothetical protein [Datura stramonium]